MRIAYVAPYQGAQLIQRRPSMVNLALAGNLKIELIAELLTRRGHDVEIISQGEAAERRFRYFPRFQETTSGAPKIPVFYGASLPIRFINTFWSVRSLISVFERRRGVRPFDAVIIYNLKLPQVEVALRAADRLDVPMVVEFEDDSFVDVVGQPTPAGAKARFHRARELKALERAVGSICVSPHLQTRFSAEKPSLLLRGIISEEIVAHARRSDPAKRRQIVAFSGTLTGSKGIVPLIEAWKILDLPDWELHISGDGPIAADLRRRAEGLSSIRFRGLLNREEYAAFLAEATIGANPHEMSATPGNVFAFKIIEYLAAGLHVLSTPMGPFESELEAGVTYIEDNSVNRVAAGLSDIIRNRRYQRLAAEAAIRRYGGDAVATALDGLMRRVVVR